MGKNSKATAAVEIKKSAKKAETIVKEWLKQDGQHNETVEINIPEGGEGRTTIIAGTTQLGFNFTEYNHCCGMREIGAIEVVNSSNIPNDKLKILIKKATKLFMAENSTKDGQKFGYTFTFPINDPIFDPFELAFQELNFQMIGEFANKNSGNTLRNYALI